MTQGGYGADRVTKSSPTREGRQWEELAGDSLDRFTEIPKRYSHLYTVTFLNLVRTRCPWPEAEFLDEMDFFEVSPGERAELVGECGLEPLMVVAERVGLENVVAWCQERHGARDVETLEDLHALQCISSSGTHSPLDICGVSASPEDFQLFPLSLEQTVQIFGKQRVQLEDVPDTGMWVAEKAPEAYESWQAVFVPVYTGECMTHAYVEGASGD